MKACRREGQRRDHSGRPAGSAAGGPAVVGAGASATLARRDGGHSVQCLDLRHPQALCPQNEIDGHSEIRLSKRLESPFRQVKGNLRFPLTSTYDGCPRFPPVSVPGFRNDGSRPKRHLFRSRLGLGSCFARLCAPPAFSKAPSLAKCGVRNNPPFSS